MSPLSGRADSLSPFCVYGCPIHLYMQSMFGERVRTQKTQVLRTNGTPASRLHTPYTFHSITIADHRATVQPQSLPVTICMLNICEPLCPRVHIHSRNGYTHMRMQREGDRSICTDIPHISRLWKRRLHNSWLSNEKQQRRTIPGVVVSMCLRARSNNMLDRITTATTTTTTTSMVGQWVWSISWVAASGRIAERVGLGMVVVYDAVDTLHSNVFTRMHACLDSLNRISA